MQVEYQWSFFVVCDSKLSSNLLGRPTVFSFYFDGQRVWCKPICVWVEDGLSYKVTFVARCGLVARAAVDTKITQISFCCTSWEIPGRLYLRLIDTWWLNWVVCQADIHNYSQVSGHKSIQYVAGENSCSRRFIQEFICQIAAISWKSHCFKYTWCHYVPFFTF